MMHTYTFHAHTETPTLHQVRPIRAAYEASRVVAVTPSGRRVVLKDLNKFLADGDEPTVEACVRAVVQLGQTEDGRAFLRYVEGLETKRAGRVVIADAAYIQEWSKAAPYRNEPGVGHVELVDRTSARVRATQLPFETMEALRMDTYALRQMFRVVLEPMFQEAGK